MDPVHVRRGPLLLSRPTVLDIPRIAELCSDPAIQRWTFVPSPYAAADAEHFVRTVVGPGWDATSPTWALRLLDPADLDPADVPPEGGTGPGEDPTSSTGLLGLPVERFTGPTLDPGLLERSTLHGMVSLTDRGTGEWEVGYWLGPAARGRGLMTAAVDALLDLAVDVLRAQVVTWKCVVRDGQPNWASWRVAWRLGFRLEGVHRLEAVQRGERRDGWWGSWLPGDPRRPVDPWTGPAPLGEAVRPPTGDPREPEALVRQFHEVYGLPVADGPANVDIERIHMRMGLIAEEFAELTGACYGQEARRLVEEAWEAARARDDRTRDTVEVADALADLVYVIYGMALETGIPLHRVLAEVQGANLSKLGADGRPIYREDGKVLKGPAYHRPDVASVLADHARRVRAER